MTAPAGSGVPLDAERWNRPRRVSVVVDNDSWILPFARELVSRAGAGGDDALLVRSYAQLAEGEIAFLLGCTGLAPGDVLRRNAYNLVVHESDLPAGRGFAPLAWTILSGANTVPICLLEAVDGPPDSGPVYLRRSLVFEGHELNPELRRRQGEGTVSICMEFLNLPSPPVGEAQSGKPSFLGRRRPADSRLDPDKTIADQFDLLRIADNRCYPAFFDHRGRRYVIRIEKRPTDRMT